MNYDDWKSTEANDYYGPRVIERTCFRCKERFPMPMGDREYVMHVFCERCERDDAPAQRTPMKFARRIVTNGRVYRIQCQQVGTNDWTFYAPDYLTLDGATRVMEKWNAADVVEGQSTWTVVTPEPEHSIA